MTARATLGSIVVALLLAAPPAHGKAPRSVPSFFRALFRRAKASYRLRREVSAVGDIKPKEIVRRRVRCVQSAGVRVGKARVSRLRCAMKKPYRVVDDEGKSRVVSKPPLGQLSFVATAKGLWIVNGACKASCVAATLRAAPHFQAKPKALKKDTTADENGNRTVEGARITVRRARRRVGKRTLRVWCHDKVAREGFDGASVQRYCISRARGLVSQRDEQNGGSRGDTVEATLRLAR